MTTQPVTTITDSITQATTSALAATPANAMASLFLSHSQALSLAAHNASEAQQQGYIAMQAVTVQGVNSIVSTGNAVISRLLSIRPPPDNKPDPCRCTADKQKRNYCSGWQSRKNRFAG